MKLQANPEVDTFDFTQLDDDETCPICHSVGLLICHDHCGDVDDDGWCTRCDSAPDAVGLEMAFSCGCQDD